MELHQVLFLVHAGPFNMQACKVFQEQSIRRWPCPLECKIIHLGNHVKWFRRCRCNFLVHDDIVIPELDVVRRKGFSVGPFDTFSNLEGIFGAIITGTNQVGDIRQHCFIVR